MPFTRFSVDERVRDTNLMDDTEIGRTGTVIEVYPDTSGCSDPACCTPWDQYLVRWDDGTEETVSECWIEEVE